MKVVIEYRMESLVATALEATLDLDSVAPSFWDACSKAVSEASDASVAQAAFRQALFSHPTEAGLLDAFGVYLLNQGMVVDAAALYTEFIQSNSSTADSSLLERILIHLAQALLLSGKNESALEALLQLSLLYPDNREADFLVATALKNLREFEQAISHYRNALPYHESPVDVALDIGDCFNQLNRPDLAAEQFEEVLAGDLNDRELELIRLSLAQMYFRIGNHDKSISLYEEILEADPGNILAHYFLLISLSVVGRPRVELVKSKADSLWRSYRATQECSGVAPDPGMHRVHSDESTTVNRRLKVGILSAEIGEHVVGFFLASFLENYDRSKFEIDVLSVRNYEDQRNGYLKGLADSAIDLAGLDQVEARSLIQARNYDIIVDTSGYLHSAGLFILSTRCAPVQCHYIGFHATTGLDTIDYFIGDAETVPPEFAADYSERLWRLPRPWLARSYSDGVPIAKSMATDDRPVFGCFSSLHKLNRETLHFWGHALQAVPESLLIIKDRLSIVPSIQQLIYSVLGEFGVAPARVSFLGQTLGWREHMNHFNLIDVAFDTTPWSGATTAFDTLSMGVPLIGIRGDCTTARMSSSVLKAIGADSWISETPEEFASIARSLAADYKRLRAEKELLQHRVLNSELFDAPGLARALEHGFRQMFNAAQ